MELKAYRVATEEVREPVEEERLTARRATVKILRSLDSLMKDSRYKVKKEHAPKFDFDRKKVAAGFCDTFVQE